jgi:gamma-glutamyltranspeptidase/glutathione hydrolase
VASESSICSQIGINLLKAGGNAADAVVGTTFCVGVVGMYHSGIGGGGIMIVRTPQGTYEDIDFRGTAPAAAFEDMYLGNLNGSMKGGLASGIPGEVRGLQYLHERYGKLRWDEVVMPAVAVAREGFEVTADLVSYMKYSTNKGCQEDFLSKNAAWVVDFAPNGTRLGAGDRMTRKRYANTLERIAMKGPDAFYEGRIAELMIEALQKMNGTMTMQDLKKYTVAIRKPIEVEYRGYKLHSCGAPSSGPVALAVMKVVEGYKDFGLATSLNLSTHRLDEAIRFGYGMRVNLGDPSFVKHLQENVDEMINEATAAEIRLRISDSKTFDVSYYDPSGIEVLNSRGTSHIVAADSSGLAISMTTSINLLFGSQVIVPETGIIMNSEMNDFSIPNTTNAFGYVPSPLNYIRPGARPLSSISPVIVDDPFGRLYFVTGAAGGSRITTATIQSLWHVLDHNMTVLEALRAPRFHDQLIPSQVFFEHTFDNGTVSFMQERGHNISFVKTHLSSVQAVRWLANGTFEAAGEPRQKNSGGYAV